MASRPDKAETGSSPRAHGTGRMHQDVPVWHDPCCQAEPYWREVANELGIDLDGDGPRRVSTGRMHENVPVWSDPCCCCEAEPYWREVAVELGIDVDGDGRQRQDHV